jgi:hypothetical protein
MELYINECSVIGQAKDREDALKLLQHLITTFSDAKKIAHDKKGYISREIYTKILYQGITVKDFLRERINDNDPIEAKFRKLAVEVLFMKPRMDPNTAHLAKSETLKDKIGDCLKNTCFDHAASSKCGSLVISMKQNKNYTNNYVEIRSSKFGIKKVLNISDVDMLNKIIWAYEHHHKHGNKAALNYGKVASPMTLNKIEVEEALLNGILINKRVYSYYNQKWYKFHCQENNKFHAFEFTPLQNDADDQLAVKTLTSLDFKPHGQIFSEYI